MPEDGAKKNPVLFNESRGFREISPSVPLVIITPAIKHDKGRHAGLDPASSLFLDSGFRRNDTFALYCYQLNNGYER